MAWFSQLQTRCLPKDAATTETKGVCDIFAIGSYHRAVLSNIHRLDGEEPGRPTLTTTRRATVIVTRQPDAILRHQDSAMQPQLGRAESNCAVEATSTLQM